jgi:hypothetical protein
LRRKRYWRFDPGGATTPPPGTARVPVGSVFATSTLLGPVTVSFGSGPFAVISTASFFTPFGSVNVLVPAAVCTLRRVAIALCGSGTFASKLLRLQPRSGTGLRSHSCPIPAAMKSRNPPRPPQKPHPLLDTAALKLSTSTSPNTQRCAVPVALASMSKTLLVEEYAPDPLMSTEAPRSSGSKTSE